MGKREAGIPVVELRKFVYNSLQDVFSDESICYAVYSHVMPQIEEYISVNGYMTEADHDSD